MAAQKEASMQHQAYRFIRQKIANCEYVPYQMLSESLLQEELGFSRTPVREAIGRLAQEGLLQVFPKRGIMVSGISISDIHQIFEVRSLLEPYALRTYYKNLNLNEVEHYSKQFHSYMEMPQQDVDFFALDDAFHALLLSTLENDYMIDLYDRIRTQSSRLRIMSGKFIELRVMRTMEEHASIADACLAQDWEKAAQAMVMHLKYSKESSLATILTNSPPNIC